jgi:hypothetical protein
VVSVTFGADAQAAAEELRDDGFDAPAMVVDPVEVSMPMRAMRRVMPRSRSHCHR